MYQNRPQSEEFIILQIQKFLDYQVQGKPNWLCCCCCVFFVFSLVFQFNGLRLVGWSIGRVHSGIYSCVFGDFRKFIHSKIVSVNTYFPSLCVFRYLHAQFLKIANPKIDFRIYFDDLFIFKNLVGCILFVIFLCFFFRNIFFFYDFEKWFWKYAFFRSRHETKEPKGQIGESCGCGRTEV